MPTYEYACSSCDTTHEVQQKMSDAALTDCPACGESGLRKLFSGVGIHFKGSGFYRTDSRDSKASSGTTSSTSSSGSSGDSSSSGASTSGSSTSGSSSTSTPSTSTSSSSSSSTPAATSA